MSTKRKTPEKSKTSGRKRASKARATSKTAKKAKKAGTKTPRRREPNPEPSVEAEPELMSSETSGAADERAEVRPAEASSATFGKAEVDESAEAPDAGETRDRVEADVSVEEAQLDEEPTDPPASEAAAAATPASAADDAQANTVPSPTLLLSVEGLTKTYGGRPVVHGVGFSVHRGEVIGLLGKNGAGKTTTFRMTIGMVAPDEGNIRFMSRDITRWPMYKRARLGMGYLSQEPSVFRGLTVEQNLNAILELTQLTPKERVRRRDELIDEFGLGKLLHSKAAVLSGGEKRRLEIARALIMEPSLILLDEPFSGVDPIAVNDIQQIILGLTERGIGILITDHNVRETLNTTHRSFIILDGRIIAQGNRDAILADPNARKYYLGESFRM